MASSTPNLSDPNHSFDKTQQYTQVVFQQGKPILDVDLNDMSEALQAQSTAAIAEKMGYGPSQLDFREWVMTAVDGVTPTSLRNQDNFALTLGRLDTLKGIIDTNTLKPTDALNPNIIFDYGVVEDNAVTDTSDRQYSNYILRGRVTGGDDRVLIDANKNFVAGVGGHRLEGYNLTEVVNPSYANLSSTTATNSIYSDDPFVLNLYESPCRIRFLSGALEGQEFAIATVSSSTTLKYASALTTVPNIGDEYVILPPNTLKEYRDLYDATTTQEESRSEGLSKLPKLMTYIQVFEEFISSDEDGAIQSNTLGVETTQRKQLRWCVRVARIKHSIDGEQYNSEDVTSLKTSHIFAMLADNEFVHHHTLVDSTDATASNHSGYQQSMLWRKARGDDFLTEYLGDQNSPHSSLGLSPMHFYNATEATVDSLYWAFLKATMIKTSGTTFNDFIILNVFNSETKTVFNGVSIAEQTLSDRFYPDAITDTNTLPYVHAFLSTEPSFIGEPSDSGWLAGQFKAPPRVFHTQAELSLDNMRSRTLHGVRGGLIQGQFSPLVFDSVAGHLSFVDQMLLGMSGLGSAQGATTEGNRIPAAVNYTLSDTTTGIAQSGYGIGSVKPLNPLASSSELTGFLGGDSSYELREKGSRSSHTVNHDDIDLGWSLYKYESQRLQSDPEITTIPRTDLSLRGWEEGPAQAVAFLQGLNFRKLAIKTVAHKSMDLFTISERPIASGQELSTIFTVEPASTAFQLPAFQVQESNGNLFLDSYSGAVNNLVTGGASFTSASFIPANVNRFNVKPLLEQYESSGGIVNYNGSSLAHREADVSVQYGPWNRFNTFDARVAISGTSFEGEDTPVFSTDLWSNRCTAMRLRYHVGDFYPSGEVDASGYPRNALVDSLNLFVKVEPLSLAHWMTMPKHQHSILENSISFAEGIEALLKVAHGIGDTQKLLTTSGLAKIQAESPALDELPDDTVRQVGDVDPLALPFGHGKHPFVHWYHPAMHKIKAPHPDSLGDYVTSGGVSFELTPYSKFGRRSLIIPALVPSKFKTSEGLITASGTIYDLPTIRENDQQDDIGFPDFIGTTTQDSQYLTDQVDVSEATTTNTIDDAVLPYPYHGSRFTGAPTGVLNVTADNNDVIQVTRKAITFPAIGGNGTEILPTPVYVPAARMYAAQDGDLNQVEVGFHPIMTEYQQGQWNDIENEEFSSFPYAESLLINLAEVQDVGGDTGDLPNVFNSFLYPMDTWKVPVMRAAISTYTVAGVVSLVRTSFETGLDTQVLSTDYDFTMPDNNMLGYATATYAGNQVPAIGPDNPLDTLFVGDLGTALGGFKDRMGFMSPLNLGVPMRTGVGLIPNGMPQPDNIYSQDVRDSFELAHFYLSGSLLGNSFAAINNMGLQQKLMWNCSFRVLHSRVGGMGGIQSTAPKSITEVFLAHDRTTTTEGMAPVTFPAPSNSARKPFIHLMSMHPNANDNLPNKDKMSHLYSMVSDSTGGPHGATLNASSDYDYGDNQVKTASMGDTYGADPFDYMMNEAVFGSDNPLREADIQHRNSGIEIDLLHELDLIHATPSDYGLNATSTINSNTVSILDTMPTANELTQVGDHELIFVLYTGHYGAKMHDLNDEISVDHVPPVAGCHLTATLEINRPSDRISSTVADEHHYGLEVNSAPIKTYAITSTK